MDLGLGIATIGLISAIVLGTIMSNRTDGGDQELEISHDEKVEVKDRPFGLHFAILGTVVIVAWLILSGLQVAEKTFLPIHR
ncbi:hypothetical protein P4S68_11485 [Pseudoalteromonas sp. Hal099]